MIRRLLGAESWKDLVGGGTLDFMLMMALVSLTRLSGTISGVRHGGSGAEWSLSLA